MLNQLVLPGGLTSSIFKASSSWALRVHGRHFHPTHNYRTGHSHKTHARGRYRFMGRKAGHDTDKGKGNKITRWAQSWLDWRENHHPTNAVTFVAFRQYLSELLGTALFVYVTTGSVVALGPQGLTTTPNTANNVAIALVFGFAIGAIVYATAKVSGGHLNPAVTLGFMVTSNKNIFKGLGYITSQILGGMLGSAFVRASTPRALWEPVRLGATTLQNGVTQGQGVFIEALLTFLLVFVVFGTVKLDMSPNTMGQLAGLSIGLAVLVCHMMGASLTGPSINPARSFGPAVVGGYWDDHWVYWVGPLGGGVIAAVVYQFLLTPEPSEPTPGNEAEADENGGKDDDANGRTSGADKAKSPPKNGGRQKDVLKRMEEGELMSNPHLTY